MSTYRRAVDRVIDCVREDLSEPHTIETMAAIARLSPFHFTRVFHEIVGIPPVKYLYALRIEEAKRLVITTRQKVIDICYSVGYSSLGSFNRRFVEIVGRSPRSMRGLSHKLDIHDLRNRIERTCDQSAIDTFGQTVHGTVRVPENFCGVTLIGLFSSAPPQNRPLACTVLQSSGFYSLSAPEAGNYYVIAAGLRWHDDPGRFLLQEGALHAVAGPVHVALEHPKKIDLDLSEPKPTDPPIVPSMAVLLIEEADRLSSRNIPRAKTDGEIEGRHLGFGP